jgi:hypothetical protein
MSTEQTPGTMDSRALLVSDPSSLTTQQLQRELTLLRELIETRLAAMDKAQKIFEDNLTRVPTDTDKQISHLKELHEEKFRSIEIQFRERDNRTEQNSKQSELAINAALQAAKEAVEKQNQSSAIAISKSENATTKQLDQIGFQIQAIAKSSDDKIADLKERLTMQEGQKKGLGEGWGMLVGALGFLIAIGTLITMFISK